MGRNYRRNSRPEYNEPINLHRYAIQKEETPDSEQTNMLTQGKHKAHLERKYT